MKVVAFNGSPRKNGNTAALLGVVLKGYWNMDEEGIEIMRTLGQNMD